MPSVECGAAAAAVTGGTLFQYNRKNFMYDRAQRADTEYQIMEMQLNKQDMFREDIRDLVELTAVKMDTYTIITVIQLNFCIVAMCEGRLGAGTPEWMVGVYLQSLCNAFAYFLFSVWLAMHATIAAKAYEVRLLTQIVRLPVPSWAQLEGSRTYASSYEKTEARQMFRVPFLCGRQENVANRTVGCVPRSGGDRRDRDNRGDSNLREARGDGQIEEETSAAQNFTHADPWGLERPGSTVYELDGNLQTDPRKLRHIQILREATQYWAGSDAWARVSMSFGSQQFAIGMAYYVIGYVLIANRDFVAAWLAVILFVAISWALLRIDMSLSTTEYFTSLALLLCGPICTLSSATCWVMDAAPLVIKILMPIGYLSHIGWLFHMLHLCKVTEQKNGVMLPTGYRAVLYIDVFGWIRRGVQGAAAERTSADRVPEPGTNDLPGAGPAMQSIRYEGGKPVPMRVEELAGANSPIHPSQISKAAFAPSTFCPPVKGADGKLETLEDDEHQPGSAGSRPWKIFRRLTLAFIFLWFLNTVGVCFELAGLSNVTARSQLVEEAPVHVLLQSDRSTYQLQSGRRIPTQWPHENINPIGLACDGVRQTIVATSKFGLYLADLSNGGHIKFERAPDCEAIEGESLQDVSLRCSNGKSAGACEAVVLHDKGRRLASCGLNTASEQQGHKSNATEQHSSIKLLAGEQFSAGQERVQSFALASQCSGQTRDCAYVGTSDQRVLEMKRLAEGDGNSSLYPKRLLGTKAQVAAPLAGGAIDVMGTRYLGLLQRDGRRLQVLDLQRRGAIVGLWRLPGHPERKSWTPEGPTWTAMCAAGDHLYMISKGLSPDIWQFPVPQQLRPGAEQPSLS